MKTPRKDRKRMKGREGRARKGKRAGKGREKRREEGKYKEVRTRNEKSSSGVEIRFQQQ